MTCKKCGSMNVNVQVINESKLVNKHHGCLYWILFGWWFEILMWVFLTIPRLIILILFPRKQKIVNKNITKAVCQDCGNTWKV